MGVEQDLLRSAAITRPNVSKRGAAGRLAHDRRADDRASIALWTTYLLMGLLLVGYVTYLAIAAPAAIRSWSAAGGQPALELVAGALCIARGVTRQGPGERWH